jgi:hypothetical protein
MDEPRDEIDAWLHERVRPLLPPPGAFDRVRKRARRRKLTQAAIAAGGAAVVVAAAATLPPLVIGQLRPTGVNVPATRPPTPTPAGRATSSPSPSSTPSPTPPPGTLPPAPPNFAVSSVTFVSASTGWVIGQAGTPGHCADVNPYICTSLAGTRDGGRTWYGISAPHTFGPDGATGVSQVRSLNGADGWAFGPQLYATHDGGRTWRKIDTHGMRVTDLETVDGRAFAVWARCAGTGHDFAADCTSFSLYSTPADADSWAPVPGATGLTSVVAAGASPRPAAAQLALNATTGYLLTPAGDVISGPVTSTAGWHQPSSDVGCGVSGPAQPDGLPSATMLAAAATGAGLVELCTSPAGAGQTKVIMYSPDGGGSWQAAGDAPEAGTATSLALSPTGQVLVATTAGIDISTAAVGASSQALRWRSARGASPPGGFSYVGMTTAQQGVAVPADTSLHAVWFTYDGGRRWQESPIP